MMCVCLSRCIYIYFYAHIYIYIFYIQYYLSPLVKGSGALLLVRGSSTCEMDRY